MSKPKYIVISGIDGSGKTTIIESLRGRLHAAGFDTHYIWLRYNHILAKPVHAFCRLVGLSRPYETEQGRVWRHEFYRSQMFCSFYIILTWLDAWLGRLKMLWQLRGRNPDIVICDRWVHDILIDLAVVSRRFDLLDGKWYGRFQRIVPEGTKQFLIVREATAVLACRLECREDPGFPIRQSMYQKLQEKAKAAIVVPNDGNIEQAVDFLFRQIGDDRSAA